MNRERITKYAEQIANAMKAGDQRDSYAYALGIITAYADPGTGSALSDAERLAGIRDALAALDQARGGAR